MSKDQAIGGAILVVCALVAIFYTVGLFFYQPIIDAIPALKIGETATVQFWLIAIPVFVAFVAIMAIGAWIGYTMATTPPPKPIEEITTEMEEKKEEPKVEEAPAPPAPAAPAPDKKKKP
jgi:predicted DNA-binding transcriptional regulator